MNTTLSRFGLILVSALAFTSCGRDSGAPSPATEEADAPPATTPAVVQTEVPARPLPSISPEDAAAKIGIAARLPMDYETLILADVGAFREIFGLAKEDPVEVVPGEPLLVPDDSMLDTLFHGKVVFASGPGTAAQSTRLINLFLLYSDASTRERMLELGHSAGVITDHVYQESNAFDIFWTRSFDTVIGLLEDLAPPPIIQAFELPPGEDELSPVVLASLTEMTAELPFIVPVAEDDLPLPDFRLYTFDAREALSEEMVQFALEDYLEEAQITQVYENLVNLSLTFGYGVVDGHAVFYLGPDSSGLELVDDPVQSMASRPELGVLAESGDATPLLVASAGQGMIQAMRALNESSRTLKTLAETLGLVTGLGDLQDIIVLAEDAAATYEKLNQGNDTAFGCVLWEEEGNWRFEALGGHESTSLDANLPLALLPAAPADAMLVFGMRADPETSRVASELLADLIEIADGIVSRLATSEALQQSDMDLDLDFDLAWLNKEVLPPVKRAALALVSDIGGSLGHETLFVIDRGEPIHKLPGLPPEFEGVAPLPRAAMAWKIADSDRLDSGWRTLEPALRELWELYPMHEDTKPGWPEPLDIEEEGSRSWLYPFSGITTNDFIPVATRSEQHLVLATSRNLASDLTTGLAGAPPEAATERGLYFQLRFDALHEAITLWLDAANAGGDPLMPDPGGLFIDAGEVLGFYDRLEKFETMTLRHFPQGTKWRTSFEINRRDP